MHIFMMGMHKYGGYGKGIGEVWRGSTKTRKYITSPSVPSPYYPYILEEKKESENEREKLAGV